MTTHVENGKRSGHQSRIGVGSATRTDEKEMRRIQDKIDRDLEDSFPASDPPGWTLGVSTT